MVVLQSGDWCRGGNRGQRQCWATWTGRSWGEVPYLSPGMSYLRVREGRSALTSIAVRLTERDGELGELRTRADEARAGRGAMVMVCGESGAGKTSLVESFIEEWVRDERVLWGVCDPLPTPRPLGPIHDLEHRLAARTRDVLERSDQPYDIFAAVYDDLRTAPSVLVLDDMHWADQGTIDLLRFVLRRVSQTQSLAIGIVRDDEVGLGHPMRVLLGDVARSARADSLSMPPLSVAAVE